MKNQFNPLPAIPPSSGPLHIDAVVARGGGRIGMCHFPGRRGRDSDSEMWDREIHTDLASINTWGAEVIVSLIEASEFVSLGVPHFANIMSHHSINWYHVPIQDMQLPDTATLAAWRLAQPTVMAVLQRGGRIVIHCAAGLGRTGTIAAKLLIDLGNTPDEAIAAVRAARPGTIETPAQEAFVRNSPSLAE